MNASMSARPTATLTREASSALAAAPLAVISLGAAAIHFAVIPEHLAEWWALGLFFAVLGWFQALWAVAFLVRPTTDLRRLAIAVNVATVALWAWSRIVGLPIGPDPRMPEPLGAPDLIASALELALAFGLLTTRRGPSITSQPSGGRDRADGDRGASLALVVGIVVAIATTIAIAAGSG